MDPCLDDCVMFAKRLKELGKKVNMDILKGLPHGFLNLAIVIWYLIFSYIITYLWWLVFFNRPVKKLMKDQCCVLNVLQIYLKKLKCVNVNTIFCKLFICSKFISLEFYQSVKYLKSWS